MGPVFSNCEPFLWQRSAADRSQRFTTKRLTSLFRGIFCSRSGLRSGIPWCSGFGLVTKWASPSAVAPIFVPIVVGYCFTAIANISGAQLGSLDRMGALLAFTVGTGLLLWSVFTWAGSGAE